jgi:predicted metalloprotease
MAISGGGLLLLLVVTYALGGDPIQMLDIATGGGGSHSADVDRGAFQGRGAGAADQDAEFVSVVLADTEDTWTGIFRASGQRYQPPQLVLFTDSVRSACGFTSAAVGPFYCPPDQKVYIDLGFYRELRDKFGAPGDFAQAYVIAHEVGHHVQNLLGTMDKVQRAGNSNEMSVRLELQADCYAGIYANYAQKKGILDAGDAEEALRAASAVGDDSIQRNTQGYVVPDSFTHGSSQQRIEWFARGFKSGDMRQCNTFGR